jgi:hypothetical protein
VSPSYERSVILRRSLAGRNRYHLSDRTISAVRWRACGLGGSFGGNSLAKLDALARRDCQQVSHTPNDIVLEFVRAPINKDDLPHHPHDFAAAFIVENSIELTGKMVEINGASVCRGSVVDQQSGRQIVKVESRF